MKLEFNITPTDLRRLANDIVKVTGENGEYLSFVKVFVWADDDSILLKIYQPNVNKDKGYYSHFGIGTKRNDTA